MGKKPIHDAGSQSFIHSERGKSMQKSSRLNTDWLIHKLQACKEAIIITAYWDGKFIHDILLNDLKQLGKLTIITHSRDYLAKETLLRNSFIDSSQLTDSKDSKIKVDIRLIEQSDGIFHAKAYVFGRLDKSCEVWIGSANASEAAFNQNSEILSKVHSSGKDAAVRWVEMLTKKAKGHSQCRKNTTIEHLLMSGYLWHSIPKLNRAIGTPLNKVKGWDIDTAKNKAALAGFDVEDEKWIMSLPAVLRIDRPRYADLLADLKLVGIGRDANKHAGPKLPSYTIWTTIGNWAYPSKHQELQEKVIGSSTHDRLAETWTCIAAALRDTANSAAFDNAIGIAIQNISRQQSKIDKMQLGDNFRKSVNKFIATCDTPRNRSRLFRQLEYTRVPNLYAMRDDGSDFVEEAISSWLRSILYSVANQTENIRRSPIYDLLTSLDVYTSIHCIAEKWKDASDWDEITELQIAAKEAIESAWLMCHGILPELLRTNDAHINSLIKVLRPFNIESLSTEADWETVEELLTKVYLHQTNGIELASSWQELWSEAINIFEIQEQSISVGKWLSLPWTLDADKVMWWLYTAQWSGWVWCGGIPIYDPPDSQYDSDGQRHRRAFDDDQVNYSKIGGKCLRQEIISTLGEYKISPTWRMDCEYLSTRPYRIGNRKLHDWYEIFTKRGYSETSRRDYLRRRLIAIDGKLGVAPLRCAYFNLWGEPCCCGIPLEYNENVDKVKFDQCQVCGNKPKTH